MKRETGNIECAEGKNHSGLEMKNTKKSSNRGKEKNN
jgi:hypothetical protein